MNVISKSSGALALIAMLTMSAPGSVLAQGSTGSDITVVGIPPADLSGLPEGPVIEGFISARSGDRMKVMSDDGTSTIIAISEGTEIKGGGGLDRKSVV